MAKILIIGAGVSGLSAGIYASLHGHKAVICERHSSPGGNLTGWQRGEYHIDNCIHWLTGTNPATKMYEMWRELGALGTVDVVNCDTLYTTEENGQTLSLHSDIEHLEHEMLKASPKDSSEIHALIHAVKFMQGINSIAGKEHNEGLKSSHTLHYAPTLARYVFLTTGELAKRFQSPLLRSFITSFWGEDFGAIALIMVFATFCGKNGGIPRGGSAAMARRMVERFKSLGGELMLNKNAVKINKIGNAASSVCFSDGTRIEADYVVITAEPDAVFGSLIEADMPKRIQKNYTDPRMKRFSSYHCAFACECEDVPFRGDFIFSAKGGEGTVSNSGQIILREFSHEPSFAPKGKNIIQTHTFCDENEALEFIRLRQTNQAVYEKMKAKIAEYFERVITKKFPELDGKLKCIDVWTPATYRRYTAAPVGSYMSFALPKGIPQKKCGGWVKGFSNVILATQWQQPPGGLPIAAECGKIAAEEISKAEAHRHSAKKRLGASAMLLG